MEVKSYAKYSGSHVYKRKSNSLNEINISTNVLEIWNRQGELLSAKKRKILRNNKNRRYGKNNSISICKWNGQNIA